MGQRFTRLWAALGSLSPREKTLSAAVLLVLVAAGVFLALKSRDPSSLHVPEASSSEAMEVDQVLQRSTLAMNRQNYELALNLVQEALKKFPGHTDLLLQLGKAYRKTKAYSAAEKAYRQALQNSPGCVECRNNLAVLWLEIGEYEQAIAALKQAKQMKPAYPEAYFNLGIAYEKTGKIQDAMAFYVEYLTRVSVNDSRPEPAMARERIRQLQEGI